MKKVIQTEGQQSSFSSSEHQFQPRDDDEETLWDVIEILREKKSHYFVKWAGVDPQTGKPWASSWVGKGDVTDDLVEKWKTQKAEMKERAAARRKKCAWRHFNNCSVPVMPRYQVTGVSVLFCGRDDHDLTFAEHSGETCLHRV